MKAFRNRLPPLTALSAFEVAGRLESFKKAAEELRVSQAAVSRQIGTLEDILGFELFVRGHRNVRLTERGRLLSMATTSAFAHIADALADIGGTQLEENLVVSATVAFTHFWLMPRLSAFTESHPNVRLRIVTDDATVELDGGKVDVAIRFGAGSWPDGASHLLFQDEIFPVCSPGYLDRVGPVEAPADLLRCRLLSNEADDPSWTGWMEWLAAFDVLPKSRSVGLRCSFYTDTIHAALGGQGMALGWRRLIEDLLEDSRLVRVTSAAIAPHHAYFVVVPRRRQSPGAARFVEWIRTTAKVSGS